MEIENLALFEVKCIKPKRFFDERGFFQELFVQNRYAQQGITPIFVQDNYSFSRRGTLRGMHFQRFPGQAKLVSVICGKIYDVVVDIRRDSPTFKQWVGIYLDAQEGKQLFVPVGFAHGFCVVSEDAHVCYKVSSPYNPEEEKGFRYDDPDVGIIWPQETFLLSEKDRKSPSLLEVL